PDYPARVTARGLHVVLRGNDEHRGTDFGRPTARPARTARAAGGRLLLRLRRLLPGPRFHRPDRGGVRGRPDPVLRGGPGPAGGSAPRPRRRRAGKSATR